MFIDSEERGDEYGKIFFNKYTTNGCSNTPLIPFLTGQILIE
jgi:hypothetical protein